MSCMSLILGLNAAADIRYRSGVSADLTTLRDIDDDAGKLFESAGLFLDLPDEHEFHLAERRRWSNSLGGGTTTIAIDPTGREVGFVALDQVDGQPFVAQLSVRQSHMRRGIGAELLRGAIGRLAAGAALWLTTYAHLPWNQPFYERHGFVRVDECECGEELRHQLQFERRWLPRPEQRVAMRQVTAER
jgi:GNAT superfamily N-acetyltransferase